MPREETRLRRERERADALDPVVAYAGGHPQRVACRRCGEKSLRERDVTPIRASHVIEAEADPYCDGCGARILTQEL